MLRVGRHSICLYLFVLDVENQRKMSELSRKKDELSAALARYQEALCSFNQLLEMLAGEVSFVAFAVSPIKTHCSVLHNVG